jgi:hypothetical protein
MPPSPRAVLLVEPDLLLLTAEALLLTGSNYRVTAALTQREIFSLNKTLAIALAILSASLGPEHLSMVARTVRMQWPPARILILGPPGSGLEDHLYDEQIQHSSNPAQLLADVERLYQDSWNPRSNTLDWNSRRSARAARMAVAPGRALLSS